MIFGLAINGFVGFFAMHNRLPTSTTFAPLKIEKIFGAFRVKRVVRDRQFIYKYYFVVFTKSLGKMSIFRKSKMDLNMSYLMVEVPV